MKARIAIAAIALAGGFVTACSPAASDQPLVIVTTNILGDVVTEMVGDEAEVLTLMPPGADPHSFGISAQTAARMREAELIVANGLGLEEGLASHVAAAEADGVPIFFAGDHIDVLDYTDGESAGQPDSHFWTDPARMIDVVTVLGDTLADINGLDPSAVADHTANYVSELEALDAEMTSAFEAIPEARRALVTNHHVFGYLADRFGFRVIGAVIPSGTTLAAPSASDLRGLVSAIDEAGVTTIFAESSQPDRLMQVLASETNRDVTVVELVTESLTAPDGDAPTYLAMMRVNTARIATGLDGS
ncbi:zinc ABC transporter substrate-binding protein AztC [Hoyosella sp. YIM 151337]|uniref:zinc ABC transporter substrate-binding protein AztC n=1 Tax=Hoyosella sp. YIM 151337 TaxID=2992742 RepID=UPI002235C976|nr:zinc ABC transporter substrate-binding protein AztC [Hoyosella sp. YIM 151337]MCW4352775.1 zinc ABC transporter substrate-binding protein AztC [Hoyosella sp. YIM 151337]